MRVSTSVFQNLAYTDQKIILIEIYHGWAMVISPCRSVCICTFTCS